MATSENPHIPEEAVKAACAVMVTRGSVREVLEAALPFIRDAILGEMPGGILPMRSLDPDRLLELRQQLALVVRKYGGLVVLPPRDVAEIPEFFATGQLPDGSLVLTTDEETVTPVDPPE